MKSNKHTNIRNKKVGESMLAQATEVEDEITISKWQQRLINISNKLGLCFAIYQK